MLIIQWIGAFGREDELTDAIAKCLRTPIDELLRIGHAGCQRVIERHASDTEAAEFAALFLAPSPIQLRSPKKES